IMWGTSVPHSRPTRRLLARWVSMKLRCRPPSLQNGLSALTAPAPLVQRLPAERAMPGIQLVRRGILNTARDWQAILREANAARTQVGLDLLVLHAVEPVSFEQRFQAVC